MTKTEEFRGKLVNLVHSCLVKKINSEEYTIDRYALIQGTLKACKEDGLMFTRTGMRGDDVEGSCLCQVEEIEV